MLILSVWRVVFLVFAHTLATVFSAICVDMKGIS